MKISKGQIPPAIVKVRSISGRLGDDSYEHLKRGFEIS